MRVINEAIASADAFTKMLTRLEEPNQGPAHYISLPDRREGENRAARRARQRDERRNAKKAGKQVAA